MAINSRAEGRLGIETDSLVYETYFITRCFTYNMSSWRKMPVLKTFIPYMTLLWACIKYQRFHFYCDRGITPSFKWRQFNTAELKLLRSLNKQVFFWTYGADVRTMDRTKRLGEPNCCTDCQSPGDGCICDERLGQDNIQNIARYSDAIFAMGDMIEYTPGSKNGLFFWPVDLEADDGRKYQPYYPSPSVDRPLRIVHAPNHRLYKGTKYLIDAVESIRMEGGDVELFLVEKVPNEEALKIYRTADIIFDQCLIGFHGYFALEAMALGKPVMCFIRKPREYMIDHEHCPIINTHRDTVKQDILHLINRRNELVEIGKRSRRYIEEHFSMTAFALRLEKTYQDMGIKT